jgi:molybdenum cofactor synthesis domain-containing protein
MTIRVGVLTVSDRCSAGVEQDASGPLICELVTTGLGAQVLRTAIVPDEQPQISATLLAWCEQGDLDLLLTTGGTGFAPRDVTPEATMAVIERPTPGLPEAMRAAGLAVTPRAMLSRAVAGIRGRTLIVNLPGSPKAVRENLATLLPALDHGIAMLQGVPESYPHHQR